MDIYMDMYSCSFTLQIFNFIWFLYCFIKLSDIIIIIIDN